MPEQKFKLCSMAVQSRFNVILSSDLVRILAQNSRSVQIRVTLCSPSKKSREARQAHFKLCSGLVRIGRRFAGYRKLNSNFVQSRFTFKVCSVLVHIMAHNWKLVKKVRRGRARNSSLMDLLAFPHVKTVTRCEIMLFWLTERLDEAKMWWFMLIDTDQHLRNQQQNCHHLASSLSPDDQVYIVNYQVQRISDSIEEQSEIGRY